MLTGATSLDLVRDELFVSVGEVEDLLQQFLEQRDSGHLLQQAIEGLQQLRGTLNLIELHGAALLLEEMVALATDIPVHEGDVLNAPLSALCNSLFLLRRYLHFCRQQGGERPELLLPLINELRSHRPDTKPLPESHFYPLDPARVPPALRNGSRDMLEPKTFARLRQMFQLGLLDVIRHESGAGINLKKRALQRWEARMNDHVATLSWIASAALEAIEKTPLDLTRERKLLFSRLDREIKRLYAGQPETQGTAQLRVELLYLVALAGEQCELCQEVRRTINLPDPGYTEASLKQAFESLRGPGADVMRSVAEALQEEITSTKDMLDLLARNAGDTDQALETLDASLQRLWKTLSVLDMPATSEQIRNAAVQLEGWQPGDTQTLELVADAVLHAELLVARMETAGEVIGSLGNDQHSAPVELKEAHIVLVEESQAGLALARRALTAYVESDHDRMHLMNVPATLETVRGGLIFLGMTRAAEIIRAAARFIQEALVDGSKAPAESKLEVLADGLTSIEFYLESAERSSVNKGDVLALAEESLAELGYKVGS